MKGKDVLYHIDRVNGLIEKADKVSGYLILNGKSDDKDIMDRAGADGSLWDLLTSLKNYAEREKSRYEEALNEVEVNV